MKIVLIIPTLNSGGAERVMSELANEFSLKNNEVHLVLLVKSTQFFTVDGSITIHELGFENRNVLYKIYDELKTFIRLRGLIKRERPDIVLSFMPKYNVFTLLASRFLNLRVFVSDRNNPKKAIPFFINFLRNRTYKYATGIVAQTKVAKEILEETTKNNNIRVIPNPIRKVVNYPNN
jgi:GalNAc-alpha-(1->4)-GalNAc-alpha-(1->3)-diNAcBac-PP-undecaprenol alpha-1,4-N-acetyl-D-galactosaminyltransferase